MGSRPTGNAQDDVVADTLARVREVLGEDFGELQHTIDAQIRMDWGGERCYIAKLGESARAYQTDRDARILRDFQKGERVELLSRRWCISIRRVQQIVKT